jgi:hypothetical protein
MFGLRAPSRQKAEMSPLQLKVEMEEKRKLRRELVRKRWKAGYHFARRSLYRTRAEEFPDSYVVWKRLGLACFELEEYHEAAQALEQCVTLAPDAAPSKVWVAIARSWINYFNETDYLNGAVLDKAVVAFEVGDA